MRLLQEAGLPDGVINLVYGDGAEVAEIALADRRLAGVHFTGSTQVFNSIVRAVGSNVDRYHNYPRLVGETGERTSFWLTGALTLPHWLQQSSAADMNIRGRSVLRHLGSSYPPPYGRH
ncbi:protein of unknown function [Bradyrhizobium vignae]|uniref:Aldehyde dehydrogenase domain-containing protein n=2 Tax=Bradyrhizobium vignae TaxID=1549949 RepID=A0A2U3QA88_9BRAD|nr:protein of unknown function [Bradyrhizobium vignae]